MPHWHSSCPKRSSTQSERACLQGNDQPRPSLGGTAAEEAEEEEDAELLALAFTQPSGSQQQQQQQQGPLCPSATTAVANDHPSRPCAADARFQSQQATQEGSDGEQHCKEAQDTQENEDEELLALAFADTQ